MTDAVAADKLKQIIDKAERLEDEKREVAEQIKDVMNEAKSEGFDVKVIRLVLKLRRMAPHARAEQEELLELYKERGGDGVSEVWFICRYRIRRSWFCCGRTTAVVEARDMAEAKLDDDRVKAVKVEAYRAKPGAARGERFFGWTKKRGEALWSEFGAPAS